MQLNELLDEKVVEYKDKGKKFEQASQKSAGVAKKYTKEAAALRREVSSLEGALSRKRKAKVQAGVDAVVLADLEKVRATVADLEDAVGGEPVAE